MGKFIHVLKYKLLKTQSGMIEKTPIPGNTITGWRAAETSPGNWEIVLYISKFNISESLTPEQRPKVGKLLYAFRHIWSYSLSDIGLVTGYKHKLHVDKSINPFAHTTKEIPVNISPQTK